MPPSTTQWVQLGVSAGGTEQTPHSSSILPWDPSCEQQPASQLLPTRRGRAGLQDLEPSTFLLCWHLLVPETVSAAKALLKGRLGASADAQHP